MANLNNGAYYGATRGVPAPSRNVTSHRINGVGIVKRPRTGLRSRNPRQQAVAPRTKQAFTGRPSQAFLGMVRDAIDVTAVDCTGSSLFEQNRIGLA